METIPNETTPFHIDLGMATQFTSCHRGWLLCVGTPPPGLAWSGSGSATDVSALHEKYRRSQAHQDDRQHGRQAGEVDPALQWLSLIHISEPTRLGMISY